MFREGLKLRFNHMQLRPLVRELYLQDYQLLGSVGGQISETGSSSVFMKLRPGFISENVTLGQFKPSSNFCPSPKLKRQVGQLEQSQRLEI